MDCIIEVAVRSDVPATERGLLLERFAKSLLETQNYHVEQQVRLTGTEVDLLAREQQTGERILVECKAYRNTLSADAITKLYGVVAIKNYAAGWLISTGPLSKDAKGLREEWDQQAGNERRKLQIYDPDQLIKRLRAAGLVCDPALLPTQQQQGDTTAYLLITPDGQFWARPVLDVATGLRSSVLVFDARTGAAITTEQTLARLSETDTTLASLSWARAASSPSRPDRHIQAELQSIVQVASGDHWADYRPARPQDYVGRDQILNDVFSFFDRARARTSQTRLLAIKGPSGWGKSSTLIKIAARARNRRHRNRAFVFAVDCRAAVSRRYPEMALYAALKAAGAAGFISLPDDLSMGGTANPFATAAMRDITTQLEQQDRILCLFFDQFEELLYREELVH